MSSQRRLWTLALAVVGSWACAGIEPVPPTELRPPIDAEGGLVLGIEYAMLDTPAHVARKAPVYGELGVPGVKHFAEHVGWDQMQSGPDAPIDFTLLDAFVGEYQRAGFTELTLCLKPHSRWASKDVKPLLGRVWGGKDPTPRPEYLPHFEAWIEAVVERYDGDGVSDFPELRFPVTLVEIGSEFSSYQPEPVESYLDTLEHAYAAAHRASNIVRVAHAAFLTTPVDLRNAKTLPEVERAFASAVIHDRHHGLADMRRILDHPDRFDVVNLHNLGDPYEIEGLVRWIGLETRRRGYSKPLVISDTIHTPYIAWGPATSCTGRVLPDGRRQGLGILVPPATEEDRCRLARYFKKLVRGEPETLAWTRGFVAADHVQRAVIAAEQGVAVLNLSFTIDLPLLTGRLGRAGAGISAWGGMIRQNAAGRVLERYPNFYAIQQLGRHLVGADAVERLRISPHVRVYRIRHGPEFRFVAWRDPGGVWLPGDTASQLTISLELGAPSAWVEPVVTRVGQTAPERARRPTRGGALDLQLAHTPIFVGPAFDSE